MRLSESGAAARQTHSLFLVTTDSGLRTTTDLEKIEVRIWVRRLLRQFLKNQ